MHILFLTDNFPPEGNAPATRTYEHCREWVKQGCKVTVVTCAPNFPEGKVYKGYKNSLYTKTNMDGIDVIRVKTYITANEGFIKRTLDFLSFMLMSFFAALFVSKVNVVIATSPQFFTGISGYLVSFFKRIPFIFEIRDLWPESIKAVGALKESKMILVLEKIELFLYRKASMIITVTSSFKTNMINRGIDGDKIVVVLNGVDLDSYKPIEFKDEILANEYNLKNKFVIGYIGTHGMAHALEKIVDAAYILRDHPEIVFVFAGSGAKREALIEYAQSLELHNVVFIPTQPKARMPNLWSICDISLVSLKDTPLFTTVIPSKIFESMGMGLPIVLCGPNGEASKIVNANGCGLSLPAESPELLAQVLLNLAKNPHQCSEFRQVSSQAAQRYCRKVLASTMLQEMKFKLSA